MQTPDHLNEKLKAVFENDEFGLLNEPDLATSNSRSSERTLLISKFLEIVDFFETNHREPAFSDDMQEYILAARLDGLRKDPSKIQVLESLDLYDLLGSCHHPQVSPEKLLDDDPFGLLETEADEIFTLRHVAPAERKPADFVAQRIPSPDFDVFQSQFAQVQAELQAGKRTLISPKGADIVPGKFFVLKGIITLFLEDASVFQTKDFESGKRTRKDGRVRCLFENGTESRMLYRSFEKSLMEDGFGVSEVAEFDPTPVFHDQDEQSGYIYVLRSRSNSEAIRNIPNLFKIGFSTNTIPKRISRATKEPTYLEDEVEVVLSADCYNLDVKALESDLHRFFAKANLELVLQGSDGGFHSPREWFSVPLESIESALDLYRRGLLDEYYYDPALETVIRH